MGCRIASPLLGVRNVDWVLPGFDPVPDLSMGPGAVPEVAEA